MVLNARSLRYNDARNLQVLSDRVKRLKERFALCVCLCESVSQERNGTVYWHSAPLRINDPSAIVASFF